MSSKQFAAAVAALLTCVAGSASAADWAFDPKITLNAQSNDNHRLTDIPGQEIKVSGAELDAQLTIRAESPLNTFSLVPRLRSTLYPVDEQDESDNQYLDLAWEHRGQRVQGAFDANYSKVATLGKYFPGSSGGGELGGPDPGEGVGTSTGLNEQERVEFSPSVSFALTERTALELTGGRLEVNYDHQVANDRVDFSDLYGSAGLRFRTSQTATVAVIAGVSRYEADDGSSTDAQSLNAEWSNKLSQTSQVFVRGGANRVKSDETGSTSTNTGFNGGAGVRWSFEVTQIFFDVNHYLDPSSYGRVVARDQLRFQLSRRLGPLTTLTLAARGIRDSDTGSDSTFRDRNYAVASVGLEWRMKRQWTLGGGYDYRWRKFDGAPNDATANAFHVGITYEPHQL